MLHPCTETNSGPLTFTPRNCTVLPAPSTRFLPETLIVNAEPDAGLPGAEVSFAGGVGLVVLPELSDGGGVVLPDPGGTVGVVSDDVSPPVAAPDPEEPDVSPTGVATALPPDPLDPFVPEEEPPLDDPPPHAASESKRIPAAA